MWQKAIKKTIYTLRVDDYAPEICELTFPLLKGYAEKIGAQFHVIKDRKWPDLPPVYEKFQIYKLSQKHENDWNIYIDADALIHPDMIDFTTLLPSDTVAHHGSDFASQRWKYDRFFLRDGRHIGSGNWFTLGSSLCIELWKPLEDITYEHALTQIQPTVDERVSGAFEASHLIDDYVCSRNIAMYGLKFQTIRQLIDKIGRKEFHGMFWHAYTMPIEAKVENMKKVLKDWRLA